MTGGRESPSSHRRRIAERDFVWAVASLCNLFRIPFDAALLTGQHPPPYDQAMLLAALHDLGFKTATLPVRAGGFDKTRIPFPAIAISRAEASGRSGNDSDQRSVEPIGALALLVKSDEQRLLFFIPESDTPQIVSHQEWTERFEGIIVISRAEETDDEESTQSNFGFRWFIPELLKYRAIWRDVLIASLVIQIIGLATPLCTQVVIDKVVVHQTRSTLDVVVMALVLFTIFSGVMTWLRQYLIIHTGNRLDAVLGSRVLSRLLRLPMTYFENRPTGTLVARLHGVETIREFITGAAVSIVLDLPFLFVFLAVMFAYSWQLTLIAVSILAIIALISLAVRPLFREHLNRQFLQGAKSQSFLTEYISGMETVKSLQMEPTLERRYGDLLAAYLASGFSTRQLANTYNVIANALEQTMTLGILFIGATLVMRNDGFTVGMLVAFQMFAGRLSQPVLRLVGLWQEFQQANIAVRRLGDIMNAPGEPYSLTPSRDGNAKGHIEILDVSFRYSTHHPFLYRNLNLELLPGKITVLKGPSGSGKSTLAKLLQGFYQPTEGSIKLDGVDIRHMSANELRASLGIVPQETTLFSGTIYENLHLANPHATFQEVVKACELAEIHDFIKQLPKGYQTTVGEHGVGLSGGQKQRLAIARALLKKPRILIFDEATSNLDQATAEAFAKTVNSFKSTVTTMFITHAEPATLDSDAMIVLTTANRQQSIATRDGNEGQTEMEL
ncbi:peptidase domain-containing ABC transporter [Solimonas marina]|uniref:Peptidase domain-containing ABC transporter n=1 Tax=Solimonas marina TaxID=2714601 RepID=A0A970BAG2_9GAMM|nr:peptidase domain-containing ABC transporter [Solimonas marina]NKF23346.1 peptidase domain-containing ABC transporter [Solimonas marina]